MDSLYSHLILLQIVFVSFHYLLPENEQPSFSSRHQTCGAETQPA